MTNSRIKDPGIGFSSDKGAKRFVNKDGSSNIKHINRPRSITRSYNYLINISWFHFFGWVFLGYILLNVIFGIIYTIIGVSAIGEPTGSILRDFLKAFFFSAQTITTVGYGVLAPKGIVIGVISSFEALIGLLSFSFVTGLLYGRFSKPRPSIKFSKSMVLRKLNGVDCIMFRLMSRTTNIMITPRIKVTLSISQENEDNVYVNNFYNLSLERSEIMYLSTTWTVVHPIDVSSPLAQFDRDALTMLHGEILILISYYDESFAQEVYQTHSYVLKNMELDSAFEPAFYYNKEGYTMLDHNRLSVIRNVKGN